MPGPEVSRGWAVTGGFRGVGDAAPYVGGCPLTGCRANLRRGAGTPPYGCNSRKRCRGGHSLMGRSVGRGLDPSAGVCGRQGACPPPRGRGRACPARGFPISARFPYTAGPHICGPQAVEKPPSAREVPRRGGGREPCHSPKYFGQPHSSLPHRLRAEPPHRGGQGVSTPFSTA